MTNQTVETHQIAEALLAAAAMDDDLADRIRSFANTPPHIVMAMVYAERARGLRIAERAVTIARGSRRLELSILNAEARHRLRHRREIRPSERDAEASWRSSVVSPSVSERNSASSSLSKSLGTRAARPPLLYRCTATG